MKQLILIFSVLAVAACATTSARSRVEAGLLNLGLGESRAECIALEIDDRLEREDMDAVAQFLDDADHTDSASGALDLLLSIDNSRAAAAFAAAGISCAFGG